MKFDGKWFGTNKAVKKLSEYPKAVQEKAAIVVADGALAIHSEAVSSIQKIMSKGEPRGDGSFASKPRNPPNTDTGRLAKSIEWEFEKDLTKAKARVGTNLLYGKFLEFGTNDGLQERPWLSRAYAKHYDKIIKQIRNVFKGL